MKLFLILIINFFIGFISDIILNDLSQLEQFKFLHLKTYFEGKSIIIPAIYAGLTVLICILSVLLFTQNITSYNYYLYSFISGYLIDILIEKYKIFGNDLDNYYNNIGSGLWGGLAILFSSIISNLIYFIILPLLYECPR
mgnify:CR=1 FL=1